MAAADAVVFSIKGQALRVYGWINDSTTGNAIDISAGGTTLACNISKDGGAGVSSVSSPVKVTDQAGAFYVELNATEMDCYHAGLVISASVANQMEAKISVVNFDLTEITGSWWSQARKRIEHMFMYGPGYLLQKVKRNKATGTITVYQQDGTTEVGTMTYADDGTNVTKGGLS